MKKNYLVIILIVFSFLIYGCAASKPSYENKMTDVLEKSSKEIKKIDFIKAQQDEEEMEKQVKKILNIMKDFQSSIERINPPDDYYEGHSDLKEFANLYISYQKKQLKKDTKENNKNNQPGVMIYDNEEFEKLQASRRAFERAKQEIPILEYELQETFNDVFISQQTNPFGISSFGESSMQPPIDLRKKEIPKPADNNNNKN